MRLLIRSLAACGLLAATWSSAVAELRPVAWELGLDRSMTIYYSPSQVERLYRICLESAPANGRLLIDVDFIHPTSNRGDTAQIEIRPNKCTDVVGYLIEVLKTEVDTSREYAGSYELVGLVMGDPEQVASADPTIVPLRGTSTATTQTAALPPAAHPFDGQWTGSYSPSVSELPGCDSTGLINMTIRNSMISGRLLMGSRPINLSGELDEKGRIEKLYGTASLTIGSFEGEVSSGTLAGKFEIEKKSSSEYAGPIYCSGSFVVSR